MSTTVTSQASPALPEDFEPAVDDLSLYVIGGRVQNPEWGIEDALLADRLGIARLWLSERYDLKEAGALLGGMAAITRRVGIGTAAIAVYPASQMVDLPQCEPPAIWLMNLGGKVAATWAARHFDGVFLTPHMTPAATARYVGWLHDECDRIGRDPSEIRIAQPVISAPAPECDDERVRALAHARLVIELQWPKLGEAYVQRNDWDPAIVDKIRTHPLITKNMNRSTSAAADQHMTRDEVLEMCDLIPESWIQDTCAVGPLPHCLELLHAYKEAGAHEIVLYGSRMHENVSLVRAWRDEPA